MMVSFWLHSDVSPSRARARTTVRRWSGRRSPLAGVPEGVANLSSRSVLFRELAKQASFDKLPLKRD